MLCACIQRDTMRNLDQGENHDDDKRELELLKAVAQAWHAQTGNPKPTNEIDAQQDRRSSFRRRPSRFKLEAAGAIASSRGDSTASSWDFAQSLWDSYEIVTLSKKLESNLSMEADPMPLPGLQPSDSSGLRAGSKRSRESKNSFKNLLHKVSSK